VPCGHRCTIHRSDGGRPSRAGEERNEIWRIPENRPRELNSTLYSILYSNRGLFLTRQRLRSSQNRHRKRLARVPLLAATQGAHYAISPMRRTSLTLAARDDPSPIQDSRANIQERCPKTHRQIGSRLCACRNRHWHAVLPNCHRLADRNSRSIVGNIGSHADLTFLGQ